MKGQQRQQQHSYVYRGEKQHGQAVSGGGCWVRLHGDDDGSSLKKSGKAPVSKRPLKETKLELKRAEIEY